MVLYDCMYLSYPHLFIYKMKRAFIIFISIYSIMSSTGIQILELFVSAKLFKYSHILIYLLIGWHFMWILLWHRKSLYFYDHRCCIYLLFGPFFTNQLLFCFKMILYFLQYILSLWRRNICGYIHIYMHTWINICMSIYT